MGTIRNASNPTCLPALGGLPGFLAGAKLLSGTKKEDVAAGELPSWDRLGRQKSLESEEWQGQGKRGGWGEGGGCSRL